MMKKSTASSVVILFVILAAEMSLPVAFSEPVLVDLDVSSTFNGVVVFEDGKYYINGDVVLKKKTYIEKNMVVNASGITFDGNGATLVGNYLANAIWVEGKSDVVIKNFFITEYGYAIDVYFSTQITIENCTITRCDRIDLNYGVRVFHSNSSLFFNNTFRGNSIGIGLMQSGTFDNVITFNNFTLNRWGMEIGASGNLIYNNAFVNNNGTHVMSYNLAPPHINDYNVSKTPGENIIGGPYLGGNYWSNYAGEDLDEDGLGDTELPFNSGNTIFPPLLNSPFRPGGDYRPLVFPSEPGVPPAVEIDIEPDTINLNSRGRWITCIIEFHGVGDVGDIDVSSILLNDTVHAEEWPTEIGDHDGDGIEDLMVKFNRTEVFDELYWDWGLVYSDTLVITLNLNDGTELEGSDTVKVKPKQSNKGGGKGGTKSGNSQSGPPEIPPGQLKKGQGGPEHPAHPHGKPKKNKGNG